MSKWSRFTALPFSDRLKLIGYAWLLPGIHIALAGMGYRRLYIYLSEHPHTWPPYPGSESQAMAEAKHTAWLVSVAARHGFYRATCLRQSLLIWWLLRRRGIDSELRIGVSNRDGQISAHAWISLGDNMFNEGSPEEMVYAAFEGVKIE
jgi:hypothetical protein